MTAEAPLLARLVAFCGALRGADVPVTVGAEIVAAEVLVAVDPLDRVQVREGLAAALLTRGAERAAFDVLFDLWFPAAVGARGSAGPTGVRPDPAGGPPADVGRPGDAPPDPYAPVDVDGLRAALLAALTSGDDAGARAVAGEAVDVLGRADALPGRQSWFAYRVLRRMSPETLVSALLDALLAGEPRGGIAERGARALIDERLRAFRGHVETEVRRRVAEERGPAALSRTAVPPLAERVDFLRATRDDLATLRRTVQPLARRLATRLAARRRLGRRGRLDVRRTIRASLATGGVPVVTAHRPRRPHRPELVVLCDVSGSAAGFAHFTLLLTAALREQFTRVRAFAFIDTCDEVTRLLGPGLEPADAVSRMAREAHLVRFDGHSDYGHALAVFAGRWPDAVGPDTALLILGDARTNYRDPGLPVVRRLVAAARHAWWLNPEPAGRWGSGDSAAPEYAAEIPMVECRNAGQLAHFVERLLPV